MFTALALAGILVVAVCIVIMIYLILTGQPNNAVVTATTLATLESVDEDRLSNHPAMIGFNAELRAWLDGDLDAYHAELNQSRPLHINYRPQDPRQ